MKVVLAAALLVGVTTLALAAGEKITMKYDLGAENSKWKFVAGQWVRRVSGGRQVLAQTVDTQPWAVAVLEDQKFADVDVSAQFRKAYVSNERAKAESVIDVTTDTIVKVLRFDSETGVPQYDPVARKIYVNLQDQNTLAVIDPATDTVVTRYWVDGCQQNHGMAIDAERHRAFLSCEGNDTLTVFDLDAHRAIAHLPMLQGERPNNSALLGIIWQPTSKNVFLDAGVRHGISRAAPDWQFTIGLTFDFSLPGLSRP